jgi:hypothetical protein
MLYSKELEDLRALFRIEKAELEGGISVLRSLIADKCAIIFKLGREIEELQASSLAMNSRISSSSDE